MTTILNLAIDANIVLMLAFLLWWIAHRAVALSRLKTDYVLQLRLLRSVLALVLLSPLLSYIAMSLGQRVWPQTPFTVSDLAVAAYLKGDIAMPALEFEALLQARGRLTDAFASGELPVLSLGFALLAAGAFVLVLRALTTALRIRGIINNSYVWRRTASTDVRLSDLISVPFACRGLFRHHVVLPSSLLTNPHELKVVLAHEFEHLRQGDAEWELAFEFAKPVLYFNPVFHLWKRAFGQIRELNCDQNVLEKLRITPREYADCLLGFCRQGRSPQNREFAAFNVAFLNGSKGRAALEFRLLALKDARQATSGQFVYVALCTVLATGIVLAASSVRSPADWSQDRLTLSTVVNLERLEAINRGSPAGF